jgi:N-acetylmuramoyl-L-alanine amidase
MLCMMLARNGVSISRTIACIPFWAFLIVSSVQAHQWDNAGAARAFEEAHQKRTEISQSSQPVLSLYLECVKAYRKVHKLDPHFGHTPEAIYEEGLVYQEMGDNFGDLNYYKTAVNRFQLLVQDYGGSHNCPAALLRVADIYTKHLKDENGAQDAYQILRTRYKQSDAARELGAKAAITKPTPDVPATSIPTEAPASRASVVQNIRYWTINDYLRVSIDMDLDAKYSKQILSNPGRIYFDIFNAKVGDSLPDRAISVENDLLKKVRIAQNRPDMVRVVLDLPASRDYSIAESHDPFRIVIDLYPSAESKAAATKSQTPGSKPAADATGSKADTARKSGNESQSIKPIAAEVPQVQAAKVAPEAKVIEPKKKQPPLAITDIQSAVSKTERPSPAPASASPSKPRASVEVATPNKPAEISVPPISNQPGASISAQNQVRQQPQTAMIEVKTTSAKNNPTSPQQSTAGIAKPQLSGFEAPAAKKSIEAPTKSIETQTASSSSTNYPKTLMPAVVPGRNEPKLEAQSAKKPTELPIKAEVKQPASPAEIQNQKTQPPSAPDARSTPSKTAKAIPLPNPGVSAEQKTESKKADSTAKSFQATNPKAAPLTSFGDRTLTRMLGLKIDRIVIDPGHGGYDLGTVGPGGLYEKDIVLLIARDLQKLIQEQLGSEVFLTRNDDFFISLEERTAIANQHRADLFISIHANSSRNREISGVETYYLDFAKSDTEREIASRENATTASSVHELEDLIKKIAQADKSAESRELASILQKNLYSGAHKLFPTAQNRGVRSAPFIVLIGANMPSVLTEVAFISNPRDERLLKKSSNQERLVKALFSGIENYMKTLGSDLVQNQINK